MSRHTFQFIDDPELDLEFTSLGGSPGKFRLAIENVSKTISLDEKLLLVFYWRKYASAPVFVVENCLVIETHLNGRDHAALAITSEKGTAFAFAGLAIMEIPEVILETLIAHEVAHALLCVEVDTDSLPTEERQAFNQLEANLVQLTQWQEQWADRRAARWNTAYDCVALRRWLDEFLIRKGLKS